MNKLTLITRLYEYIGYDGDSIMDDIKNDYLTENEGRDGHWYIWYLDSNYNAAIRDDGKIIDEDDIENLLA